jgi:uncharacterized hydrophobic protein (TIGR00271 family)
MTKQEIIRDLKAYFNLSIDMDEEEHIIENIRKGAELKGANLWVLIFAIIIASIGLNVNSPAVIIGAMLISPLMGPLIAIGLGLSINDFDLIKLAIKNLGFALIASLIASTLYFLITPLDQAQTEILARTSPTIFDVFIALAGGLAGMVATTRKVKGNVIPGVAIATALMPPLCTAGYGIASGNWNYFFGAFYLYFINCVFIFLGTFFIVRAMKFNKKVFVDKAFGIRVRRLIYAMTIVTVLPSSYLAYDMVNKSITERKLNEFLQSEVSNKGFVIIEKKFLDEGDETNIEISAVGASITDEFKKSVNEKFKQSDIAKGKITFKSLGTSNTDIVAIKSAIIEELYRNNEKLIQDKDEKIKFLETQLAATKANSIPNAAIKSELKVLLPALEDLILSKVEVQEKAQTILLVYLKHTGKILTPDLEKTKEWLKIRTQSSDVKVFTEKAVKKVIQASLK